MWLKPWKPEEIEHFLLCVEVQTWTSFCTLGSDLIQAFVITKIYGKQEKNQGKVT